MRGNLKYVPKELLEELSKVRLNFNIDKDADGFREIAKNARIGREIRININFENKRRK